MLDLISSSVMFARFRGAPPPAARPAPPPTPSTHYGQGVPDEDIPIDVKYSKLLEWLVDRKKTRADWREKLRAIQARSPRTCPHTTPSAW